MVELLVLIRKRDSFVIQCYNKLPPAMPVYNLFFPYISETESKALEKSRKYAQNLAKTHNCKLEEQLELTQP